MDDPGHRPNPPPPRRPPAGGVFEPVALTSDHPHVARWAIVVAGVLVLVIAKPWSWGEVVPSAGEAVAPRAPLAEEPIVTPLAPAATLDPTRARVPSFCIDRRQWLVAAVETWEGQTVQVWQALTPASSATGPDDPAIPVIHVASEGALRIGWCAPTGGTTSQVGDASIEVWRRSDTGSKPQPMVRSLPVGAASPAGAMYAAPRRPLSTRSAVWPDGRYVFRYRSFDGHEAWFLVEVVTRPRAHPTG